MRWELKTINILEQENNQLKQENEKLKHQVEVFTRQLENANKEVINEKEKRATERQKNEQKLARIKQMLNIVDPCYVWYDGKKAYIGDDLIEFLRTTVIQIIDEGNNDKK